MILHNALLVADASVAGVMDAAAHRANRVRGPADHGVPVNERRDACLSNEGVEAETDRARITAVVRSAIGSGREAVADCCPIAFVHVALVVFNLEDCTFVPPNPWLLNDVNVPRLVFR